MKNFLKSLGLVALLVAIPQVALAGNGKSADSQSKAEAMKAQTEQMQADKAAEQNREVKRRNAKYNPTPEPELIELIDLEPRPVPDNEG